MSRIYAVRKKNNNNSPNSSTESNPNSSMNPSVQQPNNDDIEVDYDPDLEPPPTQKKSLETDREKESTRNYQRWSVFDRYTISLCIHLYGYKNTKIAKILGNRTASQVSF